MPTVHSNYSPTKNQSALKSSTLLLSLMITLGLLTASHSAQAGIVKIKVDTGKNGGVAFDSNGDGKRDKVIDKPDGADGKEDGIVTIDLGTKEEEKKIGTIWVIKTLGGKRVSSEVELDKDGNTLASLEPFDTPSFFSQSTDLVARIDMVTYLAEGHTFTPGQSFNIVNGVLAGTSAISFKEGSSLDESPEYSRNLIDSLPNYNGMVTVYSLDNVAPPVPEPAALLLLGAGSLLLAGRVCLHRKVS